MNAQRLLPLAGVAAAVLSTVIASPAMAATSSEAANVTGLTDSHGNAVVLYEGLSLDTGYAWNIADARKAWAPFASLIWTMYQTLMALMIAMLNFVMESAWTTVLAAPLRGLASGASQIMTTIGLAPLMLLVLGVSVAFLLIRGRPATAVAELVVGCTVFALGVGILASLTDDVTNEGGYITQAQEAGGEIAGELVDVSDDALGSVLVDTLIRRPHQYLNYGAVIDGTACEATYDEYLGTDDAWEHIGECDATYNEEAQNASGGKVAFEAIVLGPLAIGFSAYSAVIVGGMALLVLSAAWAALSTTWTSVTGIVSGAGRHSFMTSVVSVALALGLIALMQSAVVVWMTVVQVAFGSGIDIPLPLRFFFATALLWIGPPVLLVLYLRARKKARQAADRLAQLGAGSTPSRSPVKVSSLARLASQIATVRALKTAGPHAGAMPGQGGPGIPLSQPQPVTVPRATATSVNRPSTSGAPAVSSLPAVPERAALMPPAPSTGAPTPPPGPVRPSSPSSSARRAKAVKAAVLLGEVALAGATGGASAVASTVGRRAVTSAVSTSVSKALVPTSSSAEARQSRPRPRSHGEQVLRSRLLQGRTQASGTTQALARRESPTSRPQALIPVGRRTP